MRNRTWRWAAGILAAAVCSVALPGGAEAPSDIEVEASSDAAAEPGAVSSGVTEESAVTASDAAAEPGAASSDVTEESAATASDAPQELDTASSEDVAQGFMYAELANIEFGFSSGAGAWGTWMVIYSDGSFQGEYHDSEMGDMGEGYPHGSVYQSTFYGKLGEPEQVNDYTYSAKVLSMELAQEAGTEEIRDEIRYVYTDPHGMSGTDEILIYLPQTPLDELPENLFGAVSMSGDPAKERKTLDMYVLYNEAEYAGFRGFETEDLVSQKRAELEETEEIAAPLLDALNDSRLDQASRNEASGELYRIWDDKLNAVWRELMEQLDGEAKERLMDQELQWIEYKEAKIKAAGEEYGESSMRPLAENLKGAKLTRFRVYSLLSYYGYR